MKPAQLRSWMQKYGNLGVLMVASYLVWHYLWTCRRRLLLGTGSLILALVVLLPIRPHPASVPSLHPQVLAKPAASAAEIAEPISSPPVLSKKQANKNLIDALFSEDIERARAALKAGADPNTRATPEYSETEVNAFVYLLKRQYGRNSATEDPDLNQLLLDAGADPNSTDEDGCPVLVSFARLNYTLTLRYLLLHGAHVNATDQDGSTALHWAVSKNNVQAVAFLLAYGAHVNAKTQSGETPMRLLNDSNAELRRAESYRRFDGILHLDDQQVRDLQRQGREDEKQIRQMLLKAGARK